MKAGIAGYSPFSKPLDPIMREAQFRRKTKSAMGELDSRKFIPASARISGKMNLPTSHISGIVLGWMQNLAEIPSRGLQKQMVVVRHQTEAVDLRSISLCR